MTIAKTYDKLNRLAGMISTPSGRWLSRDPIEEKGGLNLYAFGSNNPNSGFDVLGSFWRFIIPSYGVGDMYSPPLPGELFLFPEILHLVEIAIELKIAFWLQLEPLPKKKKNTQCMKSKAIKMRTKN